MSYTLALGSPSFQRGVIYHEMGHYLEKILRGEGISQATSRAFGETEGCLNKVQQYVSGDRYRNFLSEDFADLVSAK